MKTLPPALQTILYDYSGHRPADCWTFEFDSGTKRWTNAATAIVAPPESTEAGTFASRYYAGGFGGARPTGMPSSEQGAGASGITPGTLALKLGEQDTSGTYTSLGVASAGARRDCAFIAAAVLPTGLRTIRAQTWRVSTARSVSDLALAGLRVSAVNLYVWRPGTGKVATIIDGSAGASAGGSNVTTAGEQRSTVFTFTGSAATGLQDGDQLVWEWWLVYTATGSGIAYLYHSGMVASETDNALVTGGLTAAPFIEAEQDFLLEPEGGRVFSVGPDLARTGDVTSGAGIEVDDLVLSVRVGDALTETIGGLPLVASAIRGLWHGVRVTFERAYMITPGDASAGLVTEFVGYVEGVDPSATEIRLTIKSIAASLSVPLPRRLMMPGCSYKLGSTPCGVNLASFTDTRTAAAGSTAAVVKLSATSTRAVPGSLLKVTSGALAGQARMVRSVSGVEVTPTTPFSSAPAAGVSLEVVRGCDKTRATCRDVFDNLLRGGMFPDVPKGEVV